MATRPVGPQYVSVDEYDVLVYPGFLRRSMARWNDDGSCAATARVRSGKGEPFNLTLTKQEVDEDTSTLEKALHQARSAQGHH